MSMSRNMNPRRMRKGVAVPAAALTVAVVAGGAYGAVMHGWGDALIGRQADGSVLTATNQRITRQGSAPNSQDGPW